MQQRVCHDGVEQCGGECDMSVLNDRALANSELANTPLGQAAAGLDSCVHCGFCLPACPTYVNLHDENDSPRGRLVLMRRLLDGELALDNSDLGEHMDRCLGCRACETACPSGVPYGQLLEATRATMQTVRPVPRVARMVLWMFKRTRLLSLALLGARAFRATRIPAWLARRVPARLAFPLAMLASSAPVRLQRLTRVRTNAPHTTAPTGDVVLLEGCVMRGLFSHTNAATSRVMKHAGYSVTTVIGQACCGALHAHAGDLDSARELARINIAAFERAPDALIAVNSAGCGAMLKEYAHLLHDDAAWHERANAVAMRVRDVSELLAQGDVVLDSVKLQMTSSESAALPVRITYDPPCHLMHAQRVTREPLAVLGSLPNVVLIPLAEADQCCGSAGIYNLVEPDTSDAVLEPKLRHIDDARADFVATGNPGCLMQIGAGLLRAGSATRAVHPIELLDAALGD